MCGTPCAAGLTCGISLSAPNKCYACNPSTTWCSGSTLHTCNSTGSAYTDTACQVCVTETATTAVCGVCSPGTKRCSGNAAQTCDATGQWPAGSSCTSNHQTCSAGACVGVCAPGEIKCVDSVNYESCNASGQWTTTTSACTSIDPTFICDYTPNTCGCPPGGSTCVTGGIEECDANGDWQVTSCQTGTICCDCPAGPTCASSISCTKFCQ
jgi:hypothetical protein